MTDDNTGDGGRIDRRKFLGGLGTGVAAGMAGCSGGGTPTEEPGGEDTPTPTQTETGIQEGGQLTIGTNIAPQTLNPLEASSVYSFFIIDRMHVSGTVTHPEDQSFQGWAFTDWSVMPDNVGSSEPAIEATLRDDLTFSDGEDLTLEDYKFTVNYFKDQEPSGSLTAAAHQKVEEVRTDGNTALVFMSEKDQRWFTNILGYPILPQHVWSDVPDYSEYIPRENEGGLVGAGAWELTDMNWENWYEFESRDFPITSADYVDFLEPGGPFVDTLRFEIFGSQNAMEQAVLNGDIDTGFVAGGFTVSNAVNAQNQDGLTVQQAQDAGFNHISYNMRRVPFDDREFRQFMNAMMDKTWVVEAPYEGIGAVEGDYVVIPALGRWRPPAPTEADEHEGIPLPDLEFPGNAGTFQLNEDQIQQARSMLTDNPDTKHDYSFEEGPNQSLVASPDNLELFVNGQPLTEAHTDNEGNGGQGPLSFSFEPPQQDIYQARYGQQMIGALKTVGVPAEAKVTAFNAQIPNIYADENFDFFSMGWAVGTNVTYLSSLYSSEGADLDGTDEALVFNPMGYTGADDLIFEDLELMDFSQREPLVKQIAAQIWYDAPTNVVEVSNVLEPTNDGIEGWVTTLGGTVNMFSFLNARRVG